MTIEAPQWFTHRVTREERIVLSVIGDRVEYDANPKDADHARVAVPLSEFAAWAADADLKPLGA